MQIEAGKAYRGEDGGGRVVESIEDGVVRYFLPASLSFRTASLAEMEAWAVDEYRRPGADDADA